MGLEFFKNRRAVISLASVLAIALGLGLAVVVKSGGKSKAPTPALYTVLVVEVGREDDGKLDPGRPLRCFVGGAFVGEITLSECARKNGIDTGALDVGVDETGALAAADQAGTVLTPLPPGSTPDDPAAAAAPAAIPASSATPAPAITPASGPLAACWRYQGAEWRRLPTEMGLNACVQVLFAGHCERPGGATYGRWGDQTLRLLPGHVEASADNRTFHNLAEQPASCAIPPIG
ncbi:MAG: hypothetical protein WCP82_08120 [Alphaproteobacteria bacterium]